MPATHATVVTNWRKYIETLVQRLATQPVKPTHVVAVIDAISSKPGVVLPWKEMVKVCKEHAIWTVVDGAHSIGQEQNIEVAKSGCDFWVSVSVRGYQVLSNHVHTHCFVIELLQMVDVQAQLYDSIRPQEEPAYRQILHPHLCVLHLPHGSQIYTGST